jgi:hypothetical protein
MGSLATSSRSPLPQNGTKNRESHLVPLAIHVTSRPHSGSNKPVTRQGILSDAKLIAKGTPAELQIILGWLLDSSRLLLLLPADKHQTWKAEVLQIIKNWPSTFGNLDLTVGRLNHATYVIPMSRHILNRVCKWIKKREPKKQRIDLHQSKLNNLALWLEFLDHAEAGISLYKIAI